MSWKERRQEEQPVRVWEGRWQPAFRVGGEGKAWGISFVWAGERL